ncbi:hypothetical protein NDU88_000402 [Pleurodeles waltl]|uniref:Uncharacterized protein n=1 Tax=Pleurodeles waltl TaxID=8319 RepID=A0AAV7V8W6_PLEWA|nr:hypothetical protein NDU88_000402 [Pleurodeles waltl]
MRTWGELAGMTGRSSITRFSILVACCTQEYCHGDRKHNDVEDSSGGKRSRCLGEVTGEEEGPADIGGAGGGHSAEEAVVHQG